MMKMRLLLAVMASVTALSAQADIKPCRDKPSFQGLCKIVGSRDKGGLEGFIEMNQVALLSDEKVWWYGHGSDGLSPGTFIPFNLLENAKFEIVQGDEQIFLNLPKGSCEQYYLLAVYYLDMFNNRGSEAYYFYKNKLEKKCPNWFK